ncbi:F-box/WD repeat-containing protein 7-like isoform X2 [Actinia tenebrosa]|uniref:F-box/WD repeat-containing protein 7-like isoform X2 n=1 Tax=Actinia tenebrosa TaxID=6105 RepID=A0A6P8HVM1_ACTTE|nr:F-box/WD repeat-containing protein 7-like isoform X2 [Actinia tenebrosa]
MNELPFELVDKIFNYLDGLSLAKSKGVCRKWRDLHDQHNYNVLWRKVCLTEIPKDVLVEILGYTKKDLLEHLEHKEAEVSCWKEVYKEWHRSRFIGKWPTMCLELKGHSSGPVYDAKISGDRVVTCGEDCTVRIWDAWTGCCLKTFQGHEHRVICLALRRKPGVSLHHDKPHDLIVSGSDDCTVCIWHMDDPGVRVKRLVHHASPINCVAIQRNIVVAALTEGSVAVWDFELNDSEILFRINSIDWVRYVGLLNDAVLTVTEKNILDLWSLSTGESLVSEVDFHHKEGICQAASRGDTTLALSRCGKLVAWQHAYGVKSDLRTSVLRNYKIIGPGAAGVQRGKCLAFSGCLVAIGTEIGPIYVYHLEKNWDNQKVHTIIHSGSTAPNSVALGDDGTGPMLLTAGNDGIARVHRWFPFSATNLAVHVKSDDSTKIPLCDQT